MLSKDAYQKYLEMCDQIYIYTIITDDINVLYESINSIVLRSKIRDNTISPEEIEILQKLYLKYVI